LCFCPFYPCLDERTLGRIVEGGEWSCQDCITVHCPVVATMIVDGLMKEETLSKVWKKVERLL
jgi:threonine-phosphate decarboxylase